MFIIQFIAQILALSSNTNDTYSAHNRCIMRHLGIDDNPFCITFFLYLKKNTITVLINLCNHNNNDCRLAFLTT